MTDFITQFTSLFFIENPFVGNSISLQPGLSMMLLLVGMLSIYKEQRRYVGLVILAGLTLSLITPSIAIDFTWPVISALIVPPLLWQLSVRLATTRPSFRWGDFLSWLMTAILIGLVTRVIGGLPPARSILLGMLASSFIWRVRYPDRGTKILGIFGQLALALLLVESDLARTKSIPIVANLVSGLGVGIFIAILGLRLAFRFQVGSARNNFCLAFMYIPYLLGILLDISPVSSTLMSGFFLAFYGFHVGLWPDPEFIPTPLVRKAIFLLIVSTWLLIGWSAHVSVTHNQALSLGASILVAGFGVLLVWRLDPIQREEFRSFSFMLIRKQTKVFLLLAGTLLLWPDDARISGESILIALGGAVLIIALIWIVVKPIFLLAGLEMKWPQVEQESKYQ